MNSVSRITNIVRTQRTIALPQVRLPFYAYLPILVFLFLAGLLIGWTSSLRQAGPPSDTFSAYMLPLPGQPHSALVALRFSCDPNNRAGQNEYCTRAPATGPFFHVAAYVSGDVISRVDLMVHQGALTVGDLALLWGRPTVHLYRKSINLDWPAQGISANGWTESGRFSYSILIHRISFGSPFISDA
jgi:hypothetical protein